MAAATPVSASDELSLPQVVAAIAADLDLPPRSVQAALTLLDDGNTVPFIARYRKEVTSGLDEIALRAIEDSAERLRTLAARKATVIKTIEEQGAMTAQLRKQIDACADLYALEALYAPYKPKRKTRASVARERGLQPLADQLLLLTDASEADKAKLLSQYVSENQDVPDAAAALQGALDIISEQWSDRADLRIWMSDLAVQRGKLVSKVKRGKQEEAEKFEQYADRSESIARMPSHRLLAMLRGVEEGVLKVELDLEETNAAAELKQRVVPNRKAAFQRELMTAAEDCYERLLLPATQSSVIAQLKEKADEEAIQVFAKNLHELLMSPPAGPRVTMGIDPGFRTGCKVAVVDRTGKFVGNTTIYPTPPHEDKEQAARTLLKLIKELNVELIAIGNGTASRETDAFVSQVIRDHQLEVTRVVVSESGASIYSASEAAAKEFPDLDLTVRGAISIARRLQDPLAELVKIDPKSIGVGQYQHDVNQTQLRKSLDRVVETCVNRVGVDVNTASAQLLAYVAGIGPKLAESIVGYRNEHGSFGNRKQLAKVPKLGRKAFEQAAGFLRIRGGDEPLDDSAVHPESYEVVSRMAQALQIARSELVGNQALTQKLDPKRFVDTQVGLPTATDIIEELGKPGRDPRRVFRAVQFDDRIHAIEDLRPGLMLEGLITNVTHFGAFVDIGVHQDALIHISQLSHNFVKDPNEEVSVGQVVQVKILEIDLPRKRISATRKF